MPTTDAVWTTGLIMAVVLLLAGASWWAADKTLKNAKRASDWARTEPSQWVKGTPDRIRGAAKSRQDQTAKAYEKWAKDNKGQTSAVLAEFVVGTGRWVATIAQPLADWARRERTTEPQVSPEPVEVPDPAPHKEPDQGEALPDPYDDPNPWGKPTHDEPAPAGPASPPESTRAVPEPTLKPASPALPPQPASPAVPAPQSNGAVMGAVTRNLGEIVGLSGVLAALKAVLAVGEEMVAIGARLLAGSNASIDSNAQLAEQIKATITNFDLIEQAYINGQLEATAHAPIAQARAALKAAIAAHTAAAEAALAARTLRGTAHRRLVAAHQCMMAAQRYIVTVHVPVAEVQQATGARAARDFSTT